MRRGVCSDDAGTDDEVEVVGSDMVGSEMEGHVVFIYHHRTPALGRSMHQSARGVKVFDAEGGWWVRETCGGKDAPHEATDIIVCSAP